MKKCKKVCLPGNKIYKEMRGGARLLHSSVCVYVYVAVYLHLSPESIFLLTLLCYDHYLKKSVFLNEAVFFSLKHTELSEIPFHELWDLTFSNIKEFPVII